MTVGGMNGRSGKAGGIPRVSTICSLSMENEQADASFRRDLRQENIHFSILPHQSFTGKRSLLDWSIHIIRSQGSHTLKNNR